MKCPYCGNEMELGLIASPYQIVWTRGDKKQSLNNVSIPEGSVVLDKYSLKSFVEGCAVKAFLCRSCKKVIIDYGKKTDKEKD